MHFGARARVTSGVRDLGCNPRDRTISVLEDLCKGTPTAEQVPLVLLDRDHAENLERR